MCQTHGQQCANKRGILRTCCLDVGGDAPKRRGAQHQRVVDHHLRPHLLAADLIIQTGCHRLRLGGGEESMSVSICWLRTL